MNLAVSKWSAVVCTWCRSAIFTNYWRTFCVQLGTVACGLARPL